MGDCRSAHHEGCACHEQRHRDELAAKDATIAALRELYEKAWCECIVSREKFRVSCDNGGPFFCVPIAPPTLLEIVYARTSHDAARAAAAEAAKGGAK